MNALWLKSKYVTVSDFLSFMVPSPFKSQGQRSGEHRNTLMMMVSDKKCSQREDVEGSGGLAFPSGILELANIPNLSTKPKMDLSEHLLSLCYDQQGVDGG